ncbi:flagellar basal body-associated FliL family protein [Piscinibacter sakaiensis]|uniref:Flagellar protein FliL n=1 Tax=Piscinibacter sakaiensis TaxID=1547922 RepID=A0A0K8P6J9_PISS1|nr:flagellar basal body-associated FliL family protein [Piscinibacter sakaiensis]GAP38231.1 flagellar biosynthesis protein FliL [Piscinibacter sakaiensis]
MAAAAADASTAPPAGKGKKKLIIILVAALVLLGGGGAAALMVMKKNAAAAAEDGEEAPVAHKVESHAKPGQPPTYVALDPFTVNLADKETERFAQVAVTLEVDDPKFAEQMKGYMPSIRSNILMILAHKTSAELLERSGKEALATEIMREAVRPMGIELDDEDAADEDAGAKSKKKKKKRAAVHNPVTHVHFANFIIQ